MSEPAADPFWLFLHIFKTAGTTLRSIVDAQFGADAVLTYYNQTNRHLLDNLPYVLRDDRRRHDALIGHFEFGLHAGLPRPAPYVTFLRDPVARAVSAYFENVKTHPNRLAAPGGGLLSLAEAMDKYPRDYVNLQTRLIVGTQDDTLGLAHLATAEDNLDRHFAFVGTVEKFPESILLLSKRLGWAPCTWGRLNPSPRTPVPDQTRAALESSNALDRAMYVRAAAALDAKIAAAGEPFAEAVAELKEALAAYGDGAEAALTDPKALPCVASYLHDSEDLAQAHSPDLAVADPT